MSAEKIGLRFHNGYVNGIVQLVAPSENVNGCFIRTCQLACGPTFVNLYASLTAPAAAGDFNTRIIFCADGATAAGSNTLFSLPYPLFVPAGLGLWAGGGSATSSIGITWDLIS